MKEFYVAKNSLLMGADMGPGKDFSFRGFPCGQAEAMGTLTVTVSVSDLWTPAEISTALWLDAADASTVTVVDGKVSQWADKSGNGCNANQSTTTKDVFYDHLNRCISAAGNGILEGNFPTIADGTINEYTVFAVVKPTKQGGTHTQSSSGVNAWQNDGNNSWFFQILGNASSTTGPVVPLFSCVKAGICLDETRNSYAPPLIFRTHGLGEAVMMLMFERNADRYTRSGINGVYANGARSGVTNLTWVAFQCPALQRVGMSEWRGDIHEVILVHNGALGAELIQTIEGYLAHKWGLTAELPSAHPYKSAPPTTED